MLFGVGRFSQICFKTSEDAEVMGLTYSSATRLYSSAKVCSFFSFFLSTESEKARDGGSYLSCSSAIAMLGKFQAVIRFRVTTGTFLAVPAACCSLTSYSKMVRNVAITI